MSSLLKDEISNAIAIVDPGLHPDVIEALRTHPGLKTLVLVSFSQNTYHNTGYFDFVLVYLTPDYHNTGTFRPALKSWWQTR